MRYIMESASEGQRIEAKTDLVLTEAQVKWAGVTSGQNVLDLGCAAGTTSRIIADLVGSSGTVVGVDGSQSRIDEARAHPGHRSWIDYRVGRAEAIPAAEGEFDVSWSRFLFEYLQTPEVTLRE